MRLRRHLANARIESSMIVSRVRLPDMCRERADLALRIALRLRKLVVHTVFGFDRCNDRLSRIFELEVIIHAIILGHSWIVFRRGSHYWGTTLPAAHQTGTHFRGSDAMLTTDFVQEFVKQGDILPEPSHDQIGAILSPARACRFSSWAISQ